MAELKLTRAELARRAGIKPTMLHDILERGNTPSVANMAKIATAMHMSLSQLYEGHIQSRQVRVGWELVGADMFDEPPGARSVDIAGIFSNPDLITLGISTDHYEVAGYRRGDVVAGIKSHSVHNLLNKDCIIETADQRRWLRMLAAGTRPNRYTLKSFHRGAADIVDAQVLWAAPISLILRD